MYQSLIGLETNPQTVLSLLRDEISGNLNFSSGTVSDLLDFEKILLFRLVNRIGNREFLRSMDQEIGIFSLSKNPRSVPMWAHYTNNHDGFCVGIDAEAICKEVENVSGFEVIYRHRDIPNEIDALRSAFGFKFREWSYEAEYRLISVGRARVLRLEPHHVNEVIFGAGVDAERLPELFEIVQAQFPSALVRLANANYDQGALHLSDLTNATRQHFELPNRVWKTLSPDSEPALTSATDVTNIFWPSDPEILILSRSSKYFIFATALEFDGVTKIIDRSFKPSRVQSKGKSLSIYFDWGFVRVLDTQGFPDPMLGLGAEFLDMVGFSHDNIYVVSVFPHSHNPIGHAEITSLTIGVVLEFCDLVSPAEFCFGNTLHKLTNQKVSQFANADDWVSLCITLVQHLDETEQESNTKFYTEGFQNFGIEEFIIRCRTGQSKYIHDFLDELFSTALSGIDLGCIKVFESRTFGRVDVEKAHSTTYNRSVNLLDVSGAKELPEFGAKYGYVEAYRFGNHGREPT